MSYGGKRVLDGVDLDVRRGEILVLLAEAVLERPPC
jgi:ABC-type multidrug transport system ATPase subunit